MDDLTIITERSFDAQATWVIDVLGICYPWVFVQPEISVLMLLDNVCIPDAND